MLGSGPGSGRHVNHRVREDGFRWSQSRASSPRQGIAGTSLIKQQGPGISWFSGSGEGNLSSLRGEKRKAMSWVQTP